jgi:hypothetical protein
MKALLVAFLTASLVFLFGCGGDEGDACPVTFSIQGVSGNYNITVSGLWSNGLDAELGNPYPMLTGRVTYTYRGETHVFDFTNIGYDTDHKPNRFTVIVDGRWTCSYP